MMLIFEEHFLDDRHLWHQSHTKEYESVRIDSYLLLRHKRPNKYWAWWRDDLDQSLYENKDLHIHVVLEQAANTGTPVCKKYGIIWGALDVSNLFCFLITDHGYYQICECKNDEWKCFAEGQQTPALRSGNGLNVLEIRRNQDLVNFYINSVLVKTLSAQIAMKVPGQCLGFMVCDENTVRVHSLLVSSTSSGTQPRQTFQTTNIAETDEKLKVSGFEQEPLTDDTLENVFADLNALIGHDSIKQQFRSLANSLKVQAERSRRGLKTISPSLHIVLFGPPGTGKTTIARLVGRLYKQLGYLQRGHVVETDRAGLIGAYLGQTAYRVNHAVEQALDGVLFIDEAHALVTEGGSSNDYGREVVQILLKRMEDHRDQLAVIVAGYTEEMKFFIESNPGLKSRFGQLFYFEHYTPDELLSIFQKFCEDSDYTIEDSANAVILEMLKTAYKERDKAFGNGRYARTIFEYSVVQQANRIANYLGDIDNASISLITTADLKILSKLSSEKFH